MKKVLLVGNDGSQSAASMGTGACIARTLRFENAIRNGGFQVTTCSPEDGYAGGKEVKEILSDDSFSSVIAISPFPAEAVILAAPSIPLWIDLHGMHPAEIQLEGRDEKRAGERTLRMLALENALLSRGDAFSTPSTRQSHAVYGELLLLGRELYFKDGFTPVVSIPNCSNGFVDAVTESDGSFTIISTGSFNRWFDPITLFNGLDSAMVLNPKIRVEVTGGGTPFCNEKYEEFVKMVEVSSLGSRYGLRGWVSQAELLALYKKASAAVYTDIQSAETLLGARTRALDWISRGIPVICTEGAEISQDIKQNNLGIVVPSGDSKALAEAVVTLAENAELAESIRHSQKKWCETTGSSSHIFSPLIRWCNNPVRLAGDIMGTPTVPPINSFRYLKRLFMELSRSMGYNYAIKRFLKRISHPLK